MASPSGISFKAIGLLVAAAMALIFIAIIGVSLMLSPPGTDASDPFPMNPDEIIDIEDTQSGGAMFVTIVDQNDPTRIASTLRADRFEPIGDGRRRLDMPESWIYLVDGRAIRVNADYATMLMPDPNQPPESGTLEGNIVIRAYESTPAPGTPAPSDQDPTLTARFEQPVEFERRYLRLRSPGRFEIESARVDFSGTDLTVILNDLRNRIELIDVMQGEMLTIHTAPGQDQQPTDEATPSPTPAAIESGPPTQVAQAASDSDQADPAAQAEAQREDDAQLAIQRYIVTLDHDVSASIAGSGSVNADTLELWASFIDGQLPDDAIRRIALAQTNSTAITPAAETPAQDPTGTNRTNETNQTAADTTPPPVPASQESDELVITWSGPMRVRPIDNEIPRQLLEDHLALRLNSTEGSGISMSAPDRGFTGQAKQLTYFATRAIAELAGEQTEAGIIKMQVDQGGVLYATALSAELATGTISMPQRGSIITLPDDPQQAAGVRWTNNARIAFAIDEQGAITQRLRSARFEGGAIAEQQGNTIGARVIDATLNPNLPPPAALTKLALTEGMISSADKRMISGRELTIDFEHTGTPDEPPYPVRISSIGSALGRTPDAMLRAQEMHADLFRNSSGDTELRSARAVGDVLYRDSRRTTANAQNLDADALQEIIVLTGPETSVTQAGSTIAGEHITMRAQRRSIEVRGRGQFDHDIALADDENAVPGQLGHINARWTDSMRFDDTLGSIECNGGVRVISTPDALTRDTLTADRVTIKLTPMPSDDPLATGRDRQRELISARASGRARPGQPPEPATVESRTYSATDPELATSVLYLEGAQILADNQKQTLRVPGEGTLLILDREQDENQNAPDRSLDGSGLTRFTWKSSMLLQRAEGLGTFNTGVRVDHKSLSSDQVATLTTDTLIARFDTKSTVPNTGFNPNTNDGAFTLSDATATGNVRFLYMGRELLCGEALYDAIADSLFAHAPENALVTLYDNTQPAPISARTMRWDLARDRVEINAPSPVRTTPGG